MPVIRTGPWLQAATPTSMTVMWEGETETPATLTYTDGQSTGTGGIQSVAITAGTMSFTAGGREYEVEIRDGVFRYPSDGDAGGDTWSVTVRPERVPRGRDPSNPGRVDTDAILYTAKLDGLSPSTTYQYHIQIGSTRSSDYEFKTLPVSGRIRVAHFADLEGMYRACKVSGDRSILSPLERYDPHFSVLSGDLGINSFNVEYRNNMAQMQAIFSKSPFYPVKGNHDNRAWSTFSKWHNTDLNNSPYDDFYSFDAGAAHFLMLRAEPGVQRLWPVDWIESDLADTRKTWKIVVIENKPITGSSFYRERSIAWLAPILRRHEVHCLLVNSYARHGRADENLLWLGSTMTCNHFGWWTVEYDESVLRATLRENIRNGEREYVFRS